MTINRKLVIGAAFLLAGCAVTPPANTALQTTTALAQRPVDAVPIPAGCVKPVYLMVWIENLDRTRTAAYGAALRSSRIVARHGGEYLMVSPPGLLFEGEWPEDRGFVVERYPCRAMLETMWYSDEYQNELVPLRENSGDYTIAVFDQWPAAPQTGN